MGDKVLSAVAGFLYLGLVCVASVNRHTLVLVQKHLRRYCVRVSDEGPWMFARSPRRDFHDQDLRGGNFQDEDLRGAWFVGANLEGTDLRRALLQNANFQRAYLHRVCLQEAHLEGANLQCVDLAYACLRQANLVEAKLSRACLREVDLQQARLSRAELRDANLRGANLGGATLPRAKLQNAQLQKAVLDRANLSGAYLRGASLQNASLREACLKGADLMEANLRGADLRGADLRGVDLEGADIGGANLQEANLVGADLQGAILTGVDLCGADLRRTNFRDSWLEGARLQGVRIEEADLRGASLAHANLVGTHLYDLELDPIAEQPKCHVGGNDISLGAVARSLKCPGLSDFMARCGHPPVVVTYLIDSLKSLDLKEMFEMLQTVFISYGAPDAAFSVRLRDALGRNGCKTWHFERDCIPGEKLHATMHKRLREHDRMVLICSRESLSRPGVLYEIEEALAYEAELGGEGLIIPIRLDGYLFSDELELDLAERSFVNVSRMIQRVVGDFSDTDSDDSKFNRSLQRLLLALRREPREWS